MINSASHGPILRWIFLRNDADHINKGKILVSKYRQNPLHIAVAIIRTDIQRENCQIAGNSKRWF